MNKDTIRRIFISIIAIYTILVVSFYFLAGDELRYKESSNNIPMIEADSVSPQIVKGISISQSFINPLDKINSIELVFTKLYRELNGTLTIQLLDN